MRIEELHIENFRCFKKLDITFPQENIAVFIGINGAGKSSLLEAIKILLSQLIIEIIQKHYNSVPKIWLENKYISSEQNQIKIEDINFENTQSVLNIKLSYECKKEKKNLSYGLKKFLYSHYSLTEIIKNLPNDLDTYSENLLIKLAKEKKDLSFPVFYFYRNSFSINDDSVYNQAPEYFDFPQMVAYFNALSSKFLTFRDFLNWFREEEDFENEIRLRQHSEFKNENLEVIRTVFKKFLSDFPDTQFSDLRIVRSRIGKVRFDRNTASPSLVITKNGQDFKLEQLSDGEKKLLMLVADIGRRLALANPSLGVDAWKGEGIILIDEIDSHLHPQWQRIVIPALTNTFPNCQFIVTTHSPQVLSQVRRECVFILEDSQIVEVTPPTYGRDSNSILSEVMLVKERPEEMQAKIDACYKLIDEEKFEEAKQALRELSDLLGETDSAIVRAQTLLEFLAE